MTAAKQLGIMQEERLQQNPEVGAKVQTFVQRVFSDLFIQELESFAGGGSNHKSHANGNGWIIPFHNCGL